MTNIEQIEFLEALSRERCLTDAESIRLERLIRRKEQHCAAQIDRPFRRWDRTDEEKLIHLARSGKQPKHIADELGRSVWSVRKRIHRLQEKDKLHRNWRWRKRGGHG